MRGAAREGAGVVGLGGAGWAHTRLRCRSSRTPVRKFPTHENRRYQSPKNPTGDPPLRCRHASLDVSQVVWGGVSAVRGTRSASNQQNCCRGFCWGWVGSLVDCRGLFPRRIGGSRGRGEGQVERWGAGGWRRAMPPHGSSPNPTRPSTHQSIGSPWPSLALKPPTLQGPEAKASQPRLSGGSRSTAPGGGCTRRSAPRA